MKLMKTSILVLLIFACSSSKTDPIDFLFDQNLQVEEKVQIFISSFPSFDFDESEFERKCSNYGRLISKSSEDVTNRYDRSQTDEIIDFVFEKIKISLYKVNGDKPYYLTERVLIDKKTGVPELLKLDTLIDMKKEVFEKAFGTSFYGRNLEHPGDMRLGQDNVEGPSIAIRFANGKCSELEYYGYHE